MNVATLKTFLTIIEAGSFVAAAGRLHVTQSTVTARINALEQDLGQQLFLRRKSGTELTSAGFKFQRYAQLMSDLWRQAQQETSLPDHVDHVLNIGCHYDLWPGMGRELLDRVRDRSPRTAFSIWSGEQSDIDRWLASGLVDAALCYRPSVLEDQTIHKLPDDQLVLVSTTPRELMRWDPGYIYVDSGEEFRRLHAEAYPDSETPTVTFGCAVWALEYLLQTGGSAQLPERLVSRYVEREELFPVPGAPVFTRRPYLIMNSEIADDWSWLPDLIESSEAALP